jgi:release factor glutamine methyltransferase
METWTLGRLLDWTTKYFTEKGLEFPRLDAEILLAHAQACPRLQLYTRYEEPADEKVRTAYRALIKQRVEGCPVAYLVGYREFFSLEFKVTPAVLIPRPETEILVMEAIRLAGPRPESTLVDVGTGSGAIAITVAKRVPGVRVVAIDISPEALQVARDNARRHGVADRIDFRQGDLLAPLAAGEKPDLIVSNPPYIPTDALPMLAPDVRDYEPKLALDGGPGGYRIISRLLDQAATRLRPGGHLLIEIDAAQEQTVGQLIRGLPGFGPPETVRDFNRHPRVIHAQSIATA